MKDKENPFKMHMHVCMHTHTHTYALDHLCSYSGDVKATCEISKTSGTETTRNEDGWEKPYFRSLGGFILCPLLALYTL